MWVYTSVYFLLFLLHPFITQNYSGNKKKAIQDTLAYQAYEKLWTILGVYADFFTVQ